ncbi:MAG: hypothetical protein H7Z14_18955 [Anaerolineae bacterium]|nr:hypothetical protein [Phycisphaerae bacterium]
MRWTKLYPAALCTGVLASSFALAGVLNNTSVTARTLVTQAANIKKGDKVLVSGRPSDIALLESVAVEVRKKGVPDRDAHR